MKILYKKLVDLISRIFRKFKTKIPPANLSNSPLNICDTRISDIDEFEQIENEIIKIRESKAKIGKNLLAKSSEEEEYVIPLAIHIIHKGEPIGTGTNISDSQIYSAVNALNEDFSKEMQSRGDGKGAKTPFRFMLLNKDDKGNPTTGIYRIDGASRSDKYKNDGIYYNGKGEAESVVKSWSRQDNQLAYNIWVVSEIGGNNGGSGVQGFAYFPTISMLDGTVLLYNAFGVRHKNTPSPAGPLYSFNLKSYTNLNRTLTHELGHALALFHTFQGNTCLETNCSLQGDRVCDTPPTIQNSNGNLPACGGTQQVDNYMDYTNQTFKSRFTPGQVERMTLAFNASRKGLKASSGLVNLNKIEADAELIIVSPKRIQCNSTSTFLRVRVSNITANIIHKIDFSYKVTVNKEIIKSGNYVWYGPIGPESIIGNDEITIAEIPGDKSCEVEVKINNINDRETNISSTRSVTIPTLEPYRVETSRDVIQGQVSWEITDALNGEILYQNPPQVNFKPGTIENTQICLPEGSYIFEIRDLVPGLQTPGAYNRLISPDGEILVNAIDGFTTITHQFEVKEKKEEEPIIEPFSLVYVKDQYYPEKGAIEFILETKNDSDIIRYNLFKGDDNRFENAKPVQSYQPRGVLVGGTNRIFGMVDERFNQKISYYFISITKKDRSEEVIFSKQYYFENYKNPLMLIIKDGVLTSKIYDERDFRIFSETGEVEYKNRNLNPGSYILVFRGERKFYFKVGIYFEGHKENIEHLRFKDGSIYSIRYHEKEISILTEDGERIPNRNLSADTVYIVIIREEIKQKISFHYILETREA